MKITRRAGAIGAGLAITGLLAVAAGIGSAGATAPPPVDVSGDHVTCTSFYGSLKFSPALFLVGTGPTTATVKAALDGCTDTTKGVYDATSNPGGVTLAAAKVSGTIGYASNNLNVGYATVTGSFTITWKTASGTPKLTSNTTTLTFTQLDTSLVTVSVSGQGANNFSNDSHGLFQLGHDASHGNTTAPSATGDFVGGDGGASSTFDGLSSASVGALAGPSGIGAKSGLKQVALGMGEMHLG